MGTVLRTGPDRIDAPDDYRTLELGKARDEAGSGTIGQDKCKLHTKTISALTVNTME